MFMSGKSIKSKLHSTITTIATAAEWDLFLSSRSVQFLSSCTAKLVSFRCLKNAFPYSYEVIIIAQAGATFATLAVIPIKQIGILWVSATV